MDWNEALDVPSFYGREQELTTLTGWVVEDVCRLVSVLGMGGIGKSTLTVTLMHRVADQFDAVIWRSLRDAPPCEPLLDELLRAIGRRLQGSVPAGTLVARPGGDEFVLVVRGGRVIADELAELDPYWAILTAPGTRFGAWDSEAFFTNLPLT